MDDNKGKEREAENILMRSSEILKRTLIERVSNLNCNDLSHVRTEYLFEISILDLRSLVKSIQSSFYLL